MGTVFLRGDSWVGEYRVNGKPKRITFGKDGIVTKTMAKKRLQEIERQIKLGQWDMLDADIPTLSEFEKKYIEYVRDVKGNRSWACALQYFTHLKDFFKNKKLSQITSKDIDDYKLTRLKTFKEIIIKNKDGTQTTKVKYIKPATVNRELACLSHIFNLAKRERRFFGNNPVSEARLLPEHNQVERILTTKEEERLIMNSSPHLVPILIMALNTGMRKGEITSLTWKDIDFENNLITVKQVVSKGKKPRRIPINSILRKTLLEQKLKTGNADYVFLSPEGNPYQRRDSLKKCFAGSCRRANIQGLRFHDLRHTAATRMVENTGNIVAVNKILGHADIKTTMRYAHPDNSLKEAVESLNTRFSKPITDKFTDTKEGQ